MAWLAVNKDGTASLFFNQPKRDGSYWIDLQGTPYYYGNQISNLTMVILVGKKLTWEDEAIKIN